MPSAHTAYRPVPEVELLGIRRISVDDAVRGLEEAIAGDDGFDAGAAVVNTPGTSLITFQQVPRVLESLRNEWSSVPKGDRPDSSCFVEVRGRLCMHMHPCFLGERLLEGMRGATGALLLRYNRILKSVPLGFKELRPAGSHGAVVGESAYVHFLMEFRAICFNPKVKSRLMGRLGSVQTPIGVNCTVLNNFNFFVHKLDLPEDAWFDSAAGGWMLHDRKIGGESNRSLSLTVTRPCVESSGTQPVNFKGVLTAHMPLNLSDETKKGEWKPKEKSRGGAVEATPREGKGADPEAEREQRRAEKRRLNGAATAPSAAASSSAGHQPEPAVSKAKRKRESAFK